MCGSFGTVHGSHVLPIKKNHNPTLTMSTSSRRKDQHRCFLLHVQYNSIVHFQNLGYEFIMCLHYFIFIVREVFSMIATTKKGGSSLLPEPSPSRTKTASPSYTSHSSMTHTQPMSNLIPKLKTKTQYIMNHNLAQ